MDNQHTKRFQGSHKSQPGNFPIFLRCRFPLAFSAFELLQQSFRSPQPVCQTEDRSAPCHLAVQQKERSVRGGLLDAIIPYHVENAKAIRALAEEAQQPARRRSGGPEQSVQARRRRCHSRFGSCHRGLGLGRKKANRESCAVLSEPSQFGSSTATFSPTRGAAVVFCRPAVEQAAA